MKNLPLGKQNFREIIREDLLYVDKTKQVYHLVQKGSLYFLSRPRRFGKSLLLSTFKELFQGNKELFKDLWVGQQTDYAFEAFSVLQFNFAKLGHKLDDLENKLNRLVLEYAEQFDVDITPTSLSENFSHLVKGISKKGNPVVLLIDEYDKPIIDFITEVDKAKVNREILRNFFSPLKDLDAEGHLKFLFITGVSKFSRVSLFSDLNNLFDLSKSPLSNDLLGITQTELEHNFKQHIDFGVKHFGISKAEFLEAVKIWYNGYSYDGKITLYNPYSLLTFFTNYEFDNYWFTTGTPTFLVETIRQQYINPQELEDIEVDNFFFDSFSLEHLDVVGLLYQTGYLTLKKVIRGIYRTQFFLGYPNLEVRHSMMHNLVQAFSYKPKSIVSSAMVRMQLGLEKGNVEIFIQQLKVILADISYHLHPKNRKGINEAEALFKMWEGYFQTIIYLVTSYMDMAVQSEITKHKGRLDLVAETDNFIYLMEFKLENTSENAIEQIKNREYAASYKNAAKTVYLVGINFSKEERNVESWEVEMWK